MENIEKRLEEIAASLDSHRKEWRSVVDSVKTENQRFRKKEFRKALIALITVGFIIYVISPFLFVSENANDFNSVNLLLLFLGPMPDFEKISGKYEISGQSFDSILSGFPANTSDKQEKELSELRKILEKQYSRVAIFGDKLEIGEEIVQEFQIRGNWETESMFAGGALWHEDKDDPGDAIVVNVVIKLEEDSLLFGFSELGHKVQDFITLKRKD